MKLYLKTFNNNKFNFLNVIDVKIAKNTMVILKKESNEI